PALARTAAGTLDLVEDALRVLRAAGAAALERRRQGVPLMIPLRDDVPSRTFPIVNILLIAVNVVFFLLELGMGEGLERFVLRAAVVPALFTGSNHVLDAGDVVRTTLDPAYSGRVLTAMFLHAGWLHLIGNMLYLWIFGDNVEDRL